jgi:hypothetical protein
MNASRMDERRKALYIRAPCSLPFPFVIAGLDPAIQEMPGSSPGMTLFDARSEMDS